MLSPMELSYQPQKIKIKIHLKIQTRHCYTYGEVDSTIILLKHPKIDFPVAVRCFSYANTS